jgi:hypothetical protein
LLASVTLIAIAVAGISVAVCVLITRFIAVMSAVAIVTTLMATPTSWASIAIVVMAAESTSVAFLFEFVVLLLDRLQETEAKTFGFFDLLDGGSTVGQLACL